MKIVTYNVNGLRQRVAQYGSLHNLLNSLDADIVCFQETKLSRQDLSMDLTMAEGYEAFVSCNSSPRGRFAYSGVATFCRVKSAFCSNEVSLPITAEEGFTGLLGRSKGEALNIDNVFDLPLEVEGKNITNEYLVKVDCEGRCIVTDHGHFVLFNLYGPRAVEDDSERLHFKLVFYKVLQKRWESLLSQGKRVVVVGDLNIAPTAMDRCDAEPGFEKNMFRQWLRSMLRECGGSFFDVFRSKHPERREAYTHFSPNVGAEEFNYGSRIDHILIAGPCLHDEHSLEGRNFFDCHAEECDIMIQFIRGRTNNTPKWNGGRNIKLEGSDHIPVYVVLTSLPDLPVHNTPSLAVRYIPEVRGRQQTIMSFLKKREYSNHCSQDATSDPVCGSTTSCKMESGVFHFSSFQGLPNSVSEPHISNPNFNEDPAIIVKGNENIMLGKTKEDQSLHHSHARVMKKAKCNSYSQLTLRSFFGQPKAFNSDGDDVSIYTMDIQSDTGNENFNTSLEPEQTCVRDSEETAEASSSELNDQSTNPCEQELDDIKVCSSSKMGRDKTAVLEWQKIQEKMRTSIPLCKGHREPCVARSVKKGPNIGRRFYVCTRAKGPESEPEANCNYFQWASIKSKQKRSK